MNPFLPMEPSALSSALSQFGHVSTVASSVVGLIVLAKLVFLLIIVSPAEKYGSVIRDVVTYFAVISVFPLLVTALIHTTGDIALQLNFQSAEPPPGTIGAYFQALESKMPFFMMFSDLGKLSVLHIARAIYTVLISLLIAIGPIVILTSVLINGSGVGSFVTALVTLSLWPVTWNLLGVLSTEIYRNSSMTSLGQFCFWLVVETLQLFSPIFSVFLLKSLATADAFNRPALVYSKVVNVVGKPIASRRMRK